MPFFFGQEKGFEAAAIQGGPRHSEKQSNGDCLVVAQRRCRASEDTGELCTLGLLKGESVS